jgi:hypothetical protein
MRLSVGIAYCGLFRIMDFFFLVLFSYNHIIFVKVMDVIIFHFVLTFIFFVRNVSRS